MTSRTRSPVRRAVPSAALVNQVADWLMQQALTRADIETLVMGCCERLQAAGVPISRGFFAFSVLHPLHSAIGITWTRGSGVTTVDYPHVAGGLSDQYQRSPHYYMRERELTYLRCRLEDNVRQYSFPLFDELIADGMTDYFAFISSFDNYYVDGPRRGINGSWSSCRKGGFSDEEIEALMRIQDRLAVTCKLAINERLMMNVTETYLGANAGKRVLDGQIKRGDGESVEAAIWYADMRNSTAMADLVESQEYIDTLNAFFDATGGAVKDAGGEILSFVGDAVLAIFPTENNPECVTTACEAALSAACEAMNRLDALNVSRTGKEPLAAGIGLHLGKVMYGNVGVAERLTFSAFGSAVNEVARLDKLTKLVGEPILVSDSFAAAVDTDWRPMGQHELRGVGRPMFVCAPSRPNKVADAKPRTPRNAASRAAAHAIKRKAS